jgi:hypothetical protein
MQNILKIKNFFDYYCDFIFIKKINFHKESFFLEESEKENKKREKNIKYKEKDICKNNNNNNDNNDFNKYNYNNNYFSNSNFDSEESTDEEEEIKIRKWTIKIAYNRLSKDLKEDFYQGKLNKKYEESLNEKEKEYENLFSNIKKFKKRKNSIKINNFNTSSNSRISILSNSNNSKNSSNNLDSSNFIIKRKDTNETEVDSISNISDYNLIKDLKLINFNTILNSRNYINKNKTINNFNYNNKNKKDKDKEKENNKHKLIKKQNLNIINKTYNTIFDDNNYNKKNFNCENLNININKINFSLVDQILYICRIMHFYHIKQSAVFSNEDKDYLLFKLSIELLSNKNKL